eukprot:761224-Rhodomonas_salina.1
MVSGERLEGVCGRLHVQRKVLSCSLDCEAGYARTNLLCGVRYGPRLCCYAAAPRGRRVPGTLPLRTRKRR